MKIKFEGKYKSLKSFEWDNIPDLAILTGLNGTGKSQLLQIISQGYNSLSYNQTPPNNVFNGGEFKMTFNDIDIEKNGLLQWQSGGGHFHFENNKFGFQDLKKICEFLLNFTDDTKFSQAIEREQDIFNSIQDKINQGNYLDPHPAFTRLFHTLQLKGKRIIEEIVKDSGKDKNLILPADIMFYLPLEILTEDSDLISQDNLDMIFYNYLYKITSMEHKDTGSYIKVEAPWDILNKVIKSAGIPYEVMVPEKKHIQSLFDNPLNELNPYQFSAKLINPIDGTDIGINNLSSGEKVIMSLAMLLYYFEYRGFKKSILILDEIDAHLHPLMTKKFFDVINNVVIKEYGSRVIMATHSPSTVALAPSESIYVIKKEAEITTIKKVNKGEALNILTFGVPSLSISYENRKQVFVESKYDAEYYDKVYNCVKQHLEAEISLNFISSGVSGRGNCDQVKDIVSRLNNAGNNSIFGIIDWDTKNQRDEKIKVLGYNKRYSIENYIFDPVLLGFYFLREKILTNEELGLDESDRFLDYTSFDEAKIQTVADKILDIIKPSFKDTTEITITQVKYINGLVIGMPDWFLKSYGHNIPNFLLEIFPPLLRYKDENGLRRDMINKTISDIPEFISIDILELFKSIQL